MSPDQRYMAKKRDEAIKLMEQKEKLIKQGLKDKLESYQVGMADEMLQRAKDLDVEAEVAKQFEAARKMIEDSLTAGNASARSINSVSQSVDKLSKHFAKKSVKFDVSASNKFSQSGNRLHHSSLQVLDEDKDSIIEESIKYAESIQSMSVSMRSASAAGMT